MRLETLASLIDIPEGFTSPGRGIVPAKKRSHPLDISKLRLTVGFDWKAALTIGLAFAVLLALGFWQLDRAAEKRDRQKTIEARLSAEPVAIEDLLHKSTESLDFQRVYLKGTYLAERSIFVADKFHRGQRGYEVFTPFKLESANQLVIVSRGWTALGSGRNELPKLDTPCGELHLTGAIHVARGHPFFIDQAVRDETWPLRLNQFSMEKIGRLFPNPVFPHVVRLDEAMPGVLHRYWPLPDMRAERSTSYAIQWFAMALLLSLLTFLNFTNIADIFRSKRP
ncbi:MAG: SURF1 family protein [Methylococcaceae bacterium]|nr:SURF1 family protein [Methylococcaceae bacterium]MCI0732822.1 SURF1 family protein [Methylococcaceae bacterium]